MKQTRKQSFIEANVNTFFGFLISYVTLLILNSVYGMDLSMMDSLEVTLVFTIVSVGRNFMIRRWFNDRIK